MSDIIPGGAYPSLIADLEELHRPYIPANHEDHRSGPAFCMYCGTRPDRLVWPCPTMEIVQKHKRTNNYLAYPTSGLDGKYRVWQRSSGKMFEGSLAECEALIDRRKGDQ